VDFSWSTEQSELREMVIDFARKHLANDVAALDRAQAFDREGWRKCAEFGIQGLPVPENYGGTGRDPLTTIAALEALGYACHDNGLMFSINAHMWTCEMPLLAFGTDEQKDRFLPGLVRGELIGGNAMSESNAGSDAYSLRTTAVRRGDVYVLNGSKLWVTNGPVADLIVVFASVDPDKGQRGVSAFIVERGMRGFAVTREVEKMGVRSSPMGELHLADCEVPVANRLGKEGAGSALFTHAMTWERGFILATAVGAMQRQLETCIRYARERKQFGEPIGKFQLVASKLVDMRMRLETARSMLYRVGWMRTRGRTAVLEAAMAKLAISEAWVQSCMDAIQIHGANGYAVEYQIEREMRDALASRIYSGTSEIQRLIIAALLGA
jgi:alkylation response protein AidB-like acyl-CoA dehydrogenase